MKPPLVLVVDDFDDARELYCACLEQAGYRVHALCEFEGAAAGSSR